MDIVHSQLKSQDENDRDCHGLVEQSGHGKSGGRMDGKPPNRPDELMWIPRSGCEAKRRGGGAAVPYWETLTL